jgi:hypothetical protein
MHFVHTFRVQLTRIPPIGGAAFVTFKVEQTIIKCTRAAWPPPRGKGGRNPSLEEHTPRMHRGGRIIVTSRPCSSAAPPHAASQPGHHSRCGCTETTPVTPEVFGLIPAVRYNLRVQTGGREAQERPMTACIDNSRAGLAGA